MKSTFVFTLSLLLSSSAFASTLKAGDYGVAKVVCGLKVIRSEDSKTFYVQGANNPVSRFICRDGSYPFKFTQSEKNPNVYNTDVPGGGFLMITTVNEEAFILKDGAGNDTMFTYSTPKCH